MKSSGYLINTARGGLVNEQALEKALNQGWIAGAALDCFESEPPDVSQRLFQTANTVFSPHTAGLTGECMRRLGITAVQNVIEALDGTLCPERVVNKQVLK